MSELNRQIAENVRGLLSQRLGAATMEQILSTRDKKLLGVMQEPDGRQFVSRVYEPGAELEYHQPGMSFAETLQEMTGMYKSAGLDVVTHSVVPTELTGGQVTVLSEYLPDAIPLRKAPLEAKQEAASGLAKLLDSSIRFLPTSEALVSDLFMANIGDDGKWHPVVVDIDPRIERKSSIGLWKDRETSVHFRMSQHIIEVGLASDQQEVAVLVRAFLGSLDSGAVESGNATLDSLMEMYFLTQSF